MTLYRTRNSTYEVDEATKRIRRIEGENKPSNHFGQDGVWHVYDELFANSCLVVEWPDGATTVTSALLDKP